MKKMRRVISWMLTFVMVLGICQVPFTVSASTRTAKQCIADLIGYYSSYQEAATTDIERVLDELETIDAAAAEDWNDIMDFWSFANTDMEVSIGVGPDGMPTDDSLCIVILGFALNSDGTMKEELIDRLRVGLATAEKYPNAYVAVTGGGTAANNPNVTEGGLMGEWMLENGLDPERLIVENRAPSTVGNAQYTYQLLVESYPQVDSVCMVTSDYHVPRGCILFNSKFILEATIANTKAINIVGYAGCDTGTNGYETISLQASGVSSVAGVSAAKNLTLSNLVSLTVTKNTEAAARSGLNLTVKANYDTGYVRDVTHLAVVEGFDPALGEEQAVKISYTENGITIDGKFALNETEKVLMGYETKLKALVEEANDKFNGFYTEDTLEILSLAVEYAEGILAKDFASDEELNRAMTTLEKAIAALELLDNIAYKKSVMASHNQAAAKDITDGSKSSYWSGYENSTNIPIEETYFVIDLAGIYDIAGITAVPYFNGENRYYHYDISVSTDNENWVKVAEQRSTEDTLEEGASFVFEEGVEARYVRVDGVAVSVEGRTDISNFHVCEMYVYGTLLQEVEVEEEVKTATNLALYGKVTGNEGALKLDQVTDGVSTSNAYYDSGKYPNTSDSVVVGDAYVVVELPGESLLESFRVVTYSKNTSKWYNWEILVSDDNATWTSVAKYEIESNPGYDGVTLTLEEPVSARYVKVQGLKTNNTGLHLVEVEAFGTMENIAEGKNTTVSKYTSRDGSYTVDGSLSNYWDSDTTWAEAAEADYPSMVLDLDGLYALDTVNVLNYRSSSRYYQYELYTSVDGEEYTLLGQKKDSENSIFSKNFDAEGTLARYIKFVGTLNSANSGFHLNELRVTGEFVNEDPADYSAVEAALAKVPTNLDLYYADTVVNLKIALSDVKEGLGVSRQKEVDAMAKAIEDAIAALEEIPAEPVFVEIITQPVDEVTEKGEDAVVTVEAIGDGLTYTWYYQNPGNKKFYESSTTFVDANVYTIPMQAWRDGQQVYCVVADAYGNTVQSNTVTISMKKADIEIVTQPQDVEVQVNGEAATVFVEAKGTDLTYTWYYKNPSNKKFYVSGDAFANENSYTIPVTAYRDGHKVYCVITDANGESVQTNTVTLSIAK